MKVFDQSGRLQVSLLTIALTGANFRYNSATGYYEVKNDDDGLWYQLRCRDNPDGVPELYLSDTGTS